jgi:uncharacterized membrane protein
MANTVDSTGVSSHSDSTAAYRTTGGRNGLGTAALVLGIFAVITCWTVVGGIVLGLLAVIFGVIGRRRATRVEASNGSAALAGALLGALGLVLTIALVAVGVTFVAHHKKAINNLESCDNHATTASQRNSCNQQFSNSVNNGNG